MWYTPISGIWQPVWIEAVCDSYIRSIRIDTTLDTVTINTVGGSHKKKLIIRDHAEYSYSGDSFTLKLDDPRHWSPEDPYLYYFTLISGDDRVSSYFALRTVGIIRDKKYPYIALNGKPYYFHGLLDQGYFSDGIYTPSSPAGYIYDILRTKELGFNMLRKHIKLEPKLFYHYCDLYGVAVFQDMINNRGYSFMLDTALPTIGIKKGLKRPAKKRSKEIFEATSKEIIKSLYNHPSVVYYTIFNEGWGQYGENRVYRELKAADPSRIYDTASGWFRPKESDVKSEHVYFKKLKLKPDKQKPLVLSEFGGYSCRIEDHCFNLDKNYGYKSIATPKEFSKALDSLYKKEIILLINNGLCASVLTQLSDVEDETNGLITYDRKVIKAEKDIMKEISKEIFNTFKNSCE